MTEAKENNEQKTEAIDTLKKISAAVNYCYNCNRCVNVCPVSQLGIFSPRNLINDLTFLSIEEALVNNNIWDCLTCGECMEYCPMTVDHKGVDVPSLVLELRKLVLNANIESQIDRVKKCETHEGIFPIITELMADNPNPPDKLSFLEGTGLKTVKQGEIAYFVGCLPLLENSLYQYGIKYTDTAKTVIYLLNENDVQPVVLNEKCCGHDIYWGRGDVNTFRKLAEYNVKLYRDAGVKTIITSCAEGYRTWKFDYPNIIEDFDFEVMHFSEYVYKEKLIKKLRFPVEQYTKVTYHDACRLGRMGGRLYDAPREILKKVPGVKLVEMENNRNEAICCGVTTFTGCNEYTRLIRKMRIEEAERTGAEYLVVPCPKCETHFKCYLSEPGLENKPKIKVIDLATFIGNRLFVS